MFDRKSSCEYSIRRWNLTYQSLREKRNLSQEDLTVAKRLYLYIDKINLSYSATEVNFMNTLFELKKVFQS